LTNVSLREVIEGSLSKVNVPSDIEVSVDKNDVKIDCDVVKLDAVFINLIVNSVQEMHQGGKIEIKISDAGDLAEIRFIDSGDGISDVDMGKIFEPLFTTKQKGTGLGLAICKNIVEQHHGEISVKNNPTTFTIRLPKTTSSLPAKR
jgi:signal transduction histidine kinase